MTKQYILKCGNQGDLVITYDEQGQINTLAIHLQEGWKPRSIMYVLPKIVTLEALKQLCTTDKHASLFNYKTTVAEPTFEDFYKPYPNKYGSKDKAKKAWKLMSEYDQAKAITWLDSYKNQLRLNPSQAVMHAATYLNQKRWEN